MSSAPAGWYPDPTDDGQDLRYWDGEAWTDHRKPADDAAVASSAVATTNPRERKRFAKEQARASKAEEQRRNAYLLTPVGQAEAAAQRGDRFFQVEIAHSTLSGYSSDFFLAPGFDQAKTTRHGAAPDLLGKIEAFGWRLEHATWLFIESGSSSREKVLSSGERTTVTGRVVGIYLFRAVDANGAAH
ncbi:DUF2510 domain-containing protein [Nocardioides terrisoli]|uniref:DUF2510 domain-containing protein n=1 Tax=Nocardioides terrisoli TaxID=3388267 RepID=UPI00287B6407|nr:DUF2510 domain-containing protein [Nocardioides marmorisolisilvae]